MMPIRDGAALVNILRDSTEPPAGQEPPPGRDEGDRAERGALPAVRWDDIASPFSVLVRPEMRRLRTLLHGRSSVANG